MFRLNLDLGPLIAGTRQLERELPQRVKNAVRPLLPEIAQWMKTNHPWTNQTGDAEKGLDALIEEQVMDLVRVTFTHNLDLRYPWYLETKYGGRWGVIRPALDTWGPRIMDALRGVL